MSSYPNDRVLADRIRVHLLSATRERQDAPLALARMKQMPPVGVAREKAMPGLAVARTKE